MMERICGRFSKKVMALLLAVCMVISMSPPFAVAAEASSMDSGAPILLSGFAELAKEVREQSVPIGTSLAELKLPDTLEAAVRSAWEDADTQPPAEPPVEAPEPETPAPSRPQDSGTVETPSAPEETSEPRTPEEPAPPADEAESADGSEPATRVLAAYVQSDIAQAKGEAASHAAVTVEGVTWESAPAYDGETAGTYIFTAILPSGYILEDSTSLPTITVAVGQALKMALTLPATSGDFGTNCTWEIDVNNVLTIAPKNGSGGTLPEFTDQMGSRPWDESKETIEKVIVSAGVKSGASLYKAFYCLSSCEEIDLTGLDTSAATNMQSMFSLTAAKTITFGDKFSTANVTDMSYMFSACNYLTTLDVSKFNTSEVTNMSNMFTSCNYLKPLNVSNFNTEKVTNMSSMFAACNELTELNVSNFKTAEVTDMNAMFSYCRLLTTLDVSTFDTSNVTDMSKMFEGCTELTSLKMDNIDTSSVENMTNMFDGCTKLTTLNVSTFNTSSVNRMGYMFKNCTALTTLDLSGFDASSNLDIGYMFQYCSNLETVKFPQVTKLGYGCFYDCNALTSLTLGAAPPETSSNSFNFAAVEGGKPGLVLAMPDGTPLTESTEPKLSAAQTAYKAVEADGNTGDNLWWGWKIGNKPSLPTEATPNITINYANEKLIGFVLGGSYTVNGTAVSPAADGTLAIEAGWFGTAVSIVKKASDSEHSDSAAQSLTIPARPAAPATLGKVDETVGGAKDGKLTGLTADTDYQLSSDSGTNWTKKTTDSTGAITGLAPGSYIVRVSPTDSSFTSLPTSAVTIAGGPKANISAKLTVTIGGWAYGDTAKAPTIAAEGGITLNQSKAAYTYSGTANDGTTLTSSTAAPGKAGSYAVTAKYEDDTQKGTATSSFTITKAALTITGGTVKSRGYIAGDKTATVTAVTFGGLKNGETLAIGTDYTVTDAQFIDANVGINKPVTAKAALVATAKTANYTLLNSALDAKGTITKEADGTKNPDYANALAELKKVHIITNATPTLETVILPEGWSFTGDKTAKLTASNDNGGKQNFAVMYTSKSPNYPDVAIAAQPFPVSTVSVAMSKLEVVVIDTIGGTESLSATVTVTGAALSGDLAVTGMEWRSSCPEIVSLSGASMGGTASVTAKGDKKGISMVGVAYKGGDMLGYVLVKVIDNRDDSSNTIDQIKDIADTLDKLVDKDKPTAGDKGAVNAVADEVTKLPEAAKEALTKDDVAALDGLKKQVNDTLTINIDETPEGTAPPAPTGVSAVGTAIACGVESGTVTYYVTPVAPTGTGTKLELKLEMKVGGSKEQLKAPLFFTMTMPSDVEVSKLKIKHVMESGSEEVEFTASGQSVSFKLNSFSGLQFIVENGTTPPPPAETTGGSSSGGPDDGQNDFWERLKDKIDKADDGEVIKVGAGGYDKLPESVIDALRKNPDVTLVIDWNGGDDITIPAGMAQKTERGRVYWPLSLLAELYGGITFVEAPPAKGNANPETGGPGYIACADGKTIPVTGAVTELDAPLAAVDAPAKAPQITPPTAGFEPDAYAGTPDVQTASGGTGLWLAVTAAMLAAAGIGGFLWKKRPARK